MLTQIELQAIALFRALDDDQRAEFYERLYALGLPSFAPAGDFDEDFQDGSEVFTAAASHRHDERLFLVA